jgi:uncharacterized protein
MLGVPEGTLQCRSIGVARFSHAGQTASLNLFWLHIYGGLWLPVDDQTNGKTTYSGGRYLFDMTKVANLDWRSDGGRILLAQRLLDMPALPARKSSKAARALGRWKVNLPDERPSRRG